MKNIGQIVALVILILGSYSYAETYICTLHRSPSLKCGGYDYGEAMAAGEFDTSSLVVGYPFGVYSVAPTVPATINAACEDASFDKVPFYQYEVTKTSDKKFEISVIKIFAGRGNTDSSIYRTKYSAPIGAAMISTPVFKDSAAGDVSTSYECKLK